MLKIKDNADLKELEKLGFQESLLQGFKVYKRVNPLLGSTELVSIENRNNPILLILTDRGSHPHHDNEYICKDEPTLLEFLGDLIQAGLVENVEDN